MVHDMSTFSRCSGWSLCCALWLILASGNLGTLASIDVDLFRTWARPSEMTGAKISSYAFVAGQECQVRNAHVRPVVREKWTCAQEWVPSILVRKAVPEADYTDELPVSPLKALFLTGSALALKRENLFFTLILF